MQLRAEKKILYLKILKYIHRLDEVDNEAEKARQRFDEIKSQPNTSKKNTELKELKAQSKKRGELYDAIFDDAFEFARELEIIGDKPIYSICNTMITNRGKKDKDTKREERLAFVSAVKKELKSYSSLLYSIKNTFC